MMYLTAQVSRNDKELDTGNIYLGLALPTAVRFRTVKATLKSVHNASIMMPP